MLLPHNIVACELRCARYNLIVPPTMDLWEAYFAQTIGKNDTLHSFKHPYEINACNQLKLLTNN